MTQREWSFCIFDPAANVTSFPLYQAPSERRPRPFCDMLGVHRVNAETVDRSWLAGRLRTIEARW